jgi:hypothetical protein
MTPSGSQLADALFDAETVIDSLMTDSLFDVTTIIDYIDHEWGREISRKDKLLYNLHTEYAMSKNPHMHRGFMGGSILLVIEYVKGLSDDLREVNDG